MELPEGARYKDVPEDLRPRVDEEMRIFSLVMARTRRAELWDRVTECVMNRITATRESVGELFEGVMIEINDPFVGKHAVPGWKCRACGWTVGAQGLPPSHLCSVELGKVLLDGGQVEED